MPTSRPSPSFPPLRGLAIVLLLAAIPAWGQNRMTEFQGKARLLRVLPDYLDRPKDAEGRDIVVLGLSPFEEALDQELSKSHLKACYTRFLPPPCNPSIVFICSSEEDQLPQILRRLKGKPVLTVSDTRGFTERGVMVGLVMREDRITLEVNLKSLREAGLDLSSHLLQRATLVGGR